MRLVNTDFSAGNNLGLDVAKGEYLIVLNNDTYATNGWMTDVIRPIRLNKNIGLVGLVTKDIDNEAKSNINYSSMGAMELVAREYTQQHSGKLLALSTVTFFCTAINLPVYDQIGGLDEKFGLGFFEDDDYCNRVREAGYRIVIAEDVFIHHHLPTSFNALGQEKSMNYLELIGQYMKKSGGWVPHSYRGA